MRVYISEEYGYRHWLWNTSMSKRELIVWWKNMQTVFPFFFNGPIEFPGMVRAIPFERIEHITRDCRVKMHLHLDDDSYLRIGKDTYLHAGYVQDPYGGENEQAGSSP